MMLHSDIDKTDLIEKIKSGKITCAGNSRLKIYGLLTCKSGNRMLKKNRVFFKNKAEAVQLGYRPCGLCLAAEYQKWRAAIK